MTPGQTPQVHMGLQWVSSLYQGIVPYGIFRCDKLVLGPSYYAGVPDLLHLAAVVAIMPRRDWPAAESAPVGSVGPSVSFHNDILVESKVPYSKLALLKVSTLG